MSSTHTLVASCLFWGVVWTDVTKTLGGLLNTWKYKGQNYQQILFYDILVSPLHTRVFRKTTETACVITWAARTSFLVRYIETRSRGLDFTRLPQIRAGPKKQRIQHDLN